MAEPMAASIPHAATGLEPYFESPSVTIWNADARDAHRWLPEASVDAVVTSPPYFGLRDYGVTGQIGLEADPADFITDLADVLTGYARVLKPGGSLWLNLGDTYAANRTYQVDQTKKQASAVVKADGPAMRVPDGWQAKSLLMIPERVILALVERGWILRNKVVWHKPNGMPESVRDRLCGKWEPVFHLVRQQTYHYDLDAIREEHAYAIPGKRGPGGGWAGVSGAPPASGEQHLYGHENGKNPGDIWSINTQPYPEAHFAVFPQELTRRPILATVPEDGTVLDPFFGSGTTGAMAQRLGRKAWGIELNPDYCALAASRFQQGVLPLASGS